MLFRPGAIRRSVLALSAMLPVTDRVAAELVSRTAGLLAALGCTVTSRPKVVRTRPNESPVVLDVAVVLPTATGPDPPPRAVGVSTRTNPFWMAKPPVYPE